MSTLRIENGDKIWKDEDGRPHREDGPAVEWATGTKYWFFHGQRHRKDGPAIEWENGDREWYYRGKLHRIGGPASYFVGSSEQWWVHGKVHRTDGPAVICDTLLAGNNWCMFGKNETKKSVTNFVFQHHLKLRLLKRILPPGSETLVDQYAL
jgi:hypothetical protein